MVMIHQNEEKEQIISLCLLVNPQYVDMRSKAEPATHRTPQAACVQRGWLRRPVTFVRPPKERAY
jgi:hypothetical protein